MSHRQPSAQRLQEIREFAAQWGKIVARRAFGEAGPGTVVDLSVMEQVAAAAAAGITAGTLTHLIQQQANLLGEEQPCPDCSKLCPVERKSRPLAVEGAQLDYDEPCCHCPDCRRDFFPPTDPAPPGQPRV